MLSRVEEGGRVRRTLGGWGRLYLDRSLPFLCVYRQPARRADPGTKELITGEAAYLVASGLARHQPDVVGTVRAIAERRLDEFGGFLIMEVWSGPGAHSPAEGGEEPTFSIIKRRGSAITDTADELEAALGRIRAPALPRLAVTMEERHVVRPPGMRPLITDETIENSGWHVLGLRVPDIYVSESTGELYPLVHRVLRRSLSGALRRAVFQFTKLHTDHRPPRYQALGSRSLTKSVWSVDQQLADIAGQFDFLLLTTPRNIEEAWHDFRRGRFERPPRFSYRPSPVDISLAKRDLYNIRVERVEDPILSELFRGQQDELDRKLTMIGDRQTGRFRQESQQLFGGVETELLQEALQILEGIPSRARERSGGHSVDARSFAQRAEQEIAALKKLDDGVRARVEIRRDISGLMVSHGNVLVGSTLSVPPGRVEALIQHEVGTHVLTHVNGTAQPFRQLRTGLASYEELQEGLAVMAEFLVGGLSRPRLRLLAARVAATSQMLDGGSFVDVFRRLDVDWGLSQRYAFTVTVRVFRGGGHTKDTVYLRGLLRLSDYLRGGGPIEPLYVGKIGFDHLSIMDELSARRVLTPVRLLPRFLGRADALERLERVRSASSLLDLVRDEERRERGS